MSCEAYTAEELEALLGDAGFEGVRTLPSLTGHEADASPHLTVVVATTPT